MDILKVLETFLTKLYHSQKEKSAKLAMFVSLVVMSLWTILSYLLSMPELLSILPVWSITYLKIALDVLALGKLIVTGAKTTQDMMLIEKTSNNSFEASTPATASEEEVIEMIEYKNTAPGPSVVRNMITEEINYPINKP